MDDVNLIPMDDAAKARFWVKVEISGADDCWLWIAGLSHGYGQFMARTREGKWQPHPAHRIALSMTSPPPFKGAHALHSCDNPPCCNPAHLRWGTPADNAKDALSRNRHCRGEARRKICSPPRGEINGNAILTAEIVRAIRADERPHKLIAIDYGTSKTNVSSIKTGRSWRHID